MSSEFRDNPHRWGWNREVRSHRDNLARALVDARRELDAADTALSTNAEADLRALRQLAAHVADALTHAASLAALKQVEFVLGDDTAKESS